MVFSVFQVLTNNQQMRKHFNTFWGFLRKIKISLDYLGLNVMEINEAVLPSSGSETKASNNPGLGTT